MNRNEARKKDMSSWDRDLSIGNVKWAVRDQKNVKMVSMFLKFVSSVPRHFVYSPNFNVLVFRKALKAQISCSKIDFGSKFRQKHFFDIFSIFSFFNFFVCFQFFKIFHQNQKNTKNKILKNDTIKKNRKFHFWIVFVKILNQNQFSNTKFELSEPSGTPKH